MLKESFGIYGVKLNQIFSGNRKLNFTIFGRNKIIYKLKSIYRISKRSASTVLQIHIHEKKKVNLITFSV